MTRCVFITLLSIFFYNFKRIDFFLSRKITFSQIFKQKVLFFIVLKPYLIFEAIHTQCLRGNKTCTTCWTRPYFILPIVANIHSVLNTNLANSNCYWIIFSDVSFNWSWFLSRRTLKLKNVFNNCSTKILF